MTLSAVAELVASYATTLAVIVAALQLYLTRQQSITEFEDGLVGQYRQVVSKLPVKVFFGAELSTDEAESTLPIFYQYFDLCNEQVFLRMRKRIRGNTWIDWTDGIKSHMALPPFAAAWSKVKEQTTSFEELRRLERLGYNIDPTQWN